jgi:two-component system, LytTR family, sensor kinase
MDSKLILITLLIKLGAAAGIAGALVRSREFKSRVFLDRRTLTQQVQLVVFIATPYALGVFVRLLVPRDFPADLSLEGVLLIGALTGRLGGALAGVLVAFPAVAAHEWLALPFFTGAGLAAGVLRHLSSRYLGSNYEDIWAFSPFIDLSLYRWLKRSIRHPRVDWLIAFSFLIVALRLAQVELAHLFPGKIFCVYSTNLWVELAAYATTVACVAVPLKIWNSGRMELKLAEQQRLLLQARMEALQSQINPHFLFNTLNTVSSLVRFDPDMAREIIVKLASILRRLLRSHESFVRLHEEVEFIDDYLDIEVVRFGRDKLRVVKELDPETLDAVVPSMLLQPLVENSIKHGLSPKVDGGSITLRSRMSDGFLTIEVEDDGVGMGFTGPIEGGVPNVADEEIDTPPSSGIGMANVAGRLKVLYGDGARMSVTNAAEQGTRVVLTLPILQTAEAGAETATAAALNYELRSSTPR